jgi:hypothetical protein
MPDQSTLVRHPALRFSCLTINPFQFPLLIDSDRCSPTAPDHMGMANAKASQYCAALPTRQQNRRDVDQAGD